MHHARYAARASALALLLVGSGTHGAEGSATTAPAFSEAAFRAHVERVSSDEFEGRALGTEGEKKTLAYIEREFRAAGLEPGIGKSYLQPVPLVEIIPHVDGAMEVRGAKASLSLRNADDKIGRAHV